MKLNYHGKLQKKDGKLIPYKDKDNTALESFKTHLLEGAIVEFFVEEVSDDGTLAQLAKCHLLVRELSIHTGFTFSELKLLIKDKAGLCISRNVVGKEYFLCKSLGDCNKDELSAFIQACKELGEEVNHPVE